MAKGVVLSTEVIEQRQGGAVISTVVLSPDARRALSTEGAQIRLPAEDVATPCDATPGESSPLRKAG
jgi:hypothetical protein